MFILQYVTDKILEHGAVLWSFIEQVPDLNFHSTLVSITHFINSSYENAMNDRAALFSSLGVQTKCLKTQKMQSFR